MGNCREMRVRESESVALGRDIEQATHTQRAQKESPLEADAIVDGGGKYGDDGEEGVNDGVCERRGKDGVSAARFSRRRRG